MSKDWFTIDAVQPRHVMLRLLYSTCISIDNLYCYVHVLVRYVLLVSDN